MIGVLTTHHCHNGLLPLLVAPSQDAEMAWQNTSSFPLCPDHRPGPTLISARPGPCGGYHAKWYPYRDLIDRVLSAIAPYASDQIFFTFFQLIA